MPLFTRDTTFLVPNSLISNYDVPDSFTFKAYNELGVLVDTDTTTSVADTQTSRGKKITVHYTVNLPDVKGDYSVEFEIVDGAKEFVHTESLYVGDAEYTNDVYTIDDSISIDIVEDLGDNLRARLFDVNTELDSSNIVLNSPGKFNLDLSNVSVSLDPYRLMVQGDEGHIFIRVFRVNPSILGALEDLRTFVDRLNRELRIDSLNFEDIDYLVWLRHGKDEFNSIPTATDFSMIKAEGPIRQMWLDCSEEVALRVRYIEEGLTSYSYNGASITLDVEVTQFLEQQASLMRDRINEAGQRLKASLWERGITGGDGQWTTAHRAIASIGLSSSYATGHYSRLFFGR